MDVRRIAEDEWERFRDVRLRALADSPSAFGSSLERERAYGEASWRERWIGRTAVFAATEDGTWVGIAGAYADPDESGLAWVVSMWVAPEGRRRGAGRRLLQACVAWAREHGAAEIRLWVSRGNLPARALYEAAGFTPTGGTQALPSDPSLQEDELGLLL